MSNHFTRNFLASLNLILLLFIIFPNTCWDITCINMNEHTQCLQMYLFSNSVLPEILLVPGSLCVSVSR